jgi:hypothetical protein
MQIRFQVLTSSNYDDWLLQRCDPLKSSSDGIAATLKLPVGRPYGLQCDLC